MMAFLLSGLFWFGTYWSQSLAAPTAPADEPQKNTDETKARQLVQALGNERFRVRDDAARQLIKLGRLAKNALLEGKQSPDAEISERCRRLLPLALEHDLQARVESFLADKEGTKEHDLPFWNRYQKIVGKDAAARKFFAEMISANTSWLEPCTQSAPAAGDQYNRRARELFEQLQSAQANGRPREIPVTDVAVLLLIGADAETSKTIVAEPFDYVVQILFQPNMQQILGKEKSADFRRLLFAWAEYRNDLNTSSQILSLIQNLNLKEGVSFAIKVMQMNNQNEHIVAQAATYVGKMGSKENSAAFDPLLTNMTQLGQLALQKPDGIIQITTNVSDMALAMSLHLVKLDLKEFGFDAIQQNPSLLWTYQYLGFSKESKRIAALIKAAGSNSLPASTRGAVLMSLAQYGKGNDVPSLEPFLNDKLVVATTTIDGKKVDVQLRDVALASAVRMSKQDLSEYGFKVSNKEDKAKLAMVTNYYFTTDEKRSGAQKKWKEWMEAQRKTKK